MRFFFLMAALCLPFIAVVIAYSRLVYPEDTPIPIGSMIIVTFLAILASFFVFTGVMLNGVNHVSRDLLRSFTDDR